MQPQAPQNDTVSTSSMSPAAPGGDPLRALAHVSADCRAELEQRWQATQQRDGERLRSGACRRVHYLSMEYLMGRALRNALAALGLDASLQSSLGSASVTLADAIEAEPDAGLGNGGLGRLAACFLDAMAEIDLPAFGHGLRYHYGMFLQQIRDGQKKFEDVASSDLNMDRAARQKAGKLEGKIQVPAIVKAVAETASGELYPQPVKSHVGWHILRVGVRKEVEPVTFESVQDEIRERLLETKEREVEQGWIQELKNRARVEILLEQQANPFAGMLGGLGGGE